MHNGASKKKCVRAGVTLSQPTARQASASPRSRVSQDSSHIRPGKLKSPSFRGEGGESGSYDELVKKETPKIQQLAVFFEE